MGDPTDIARDPIFVAGNYRNLPPKHGWANGADLEPLAMALHLAGLRRLGAVEFRTLGGNFRAERRLSIGTSLYESFPIERPTRGTATTGARA